MISKKILMGGVVNVKRHYCGGSRTFWKGDTISLTVLHCEWPSRYDTITAKQQQWE